MAAALMAAAAQAIPALLGGKGGGSKTTVTVGNTLSNAINPAISVSLGGGIMALPQGDPYVNAPATAYTADDPPDTSALGLGLPQSYYTPASTNDLTSGVPISAGGGNTQTLILFALIGGAILLLKGK